VNRTHAISALLWLQCATAFGQAPEAATPEPDAQASNTALEVAGTPEAAGENAAAPVPAVSQPAAVEPAVPLSEEELKALGFATPEGGGEVSALDTELHVFGFIDFSVSRLIADESSPIRAFLPNRTNFYIGNFNLYLTKNLNKYFRTMGEVRFLYMPNGDIPLTDGVGTPTTTTQDPADYDRPLHWGGIEIERVYLELAAHRFLSIRAGQFLTPYGIWNIDHGSPTVIPVQRPYVVGEGLFPERQTGFELFGRWDATRSGTLGYHLTLSNGQGPITEYRDLDDNKAIGGRLFWEQQQALGSLRFGGSAYYGQSTDGATNFRLTPAGLVQAQDVIYQQYDVLSLALDAVWKYRGLVVQGEWISRQRIFTESGRTAVVNDYLQQTVFPSDATSWGVYGLIGYRLPWFGIMPYYVGQYFDSTSTNGIHSEITNMQFGLNIRPYDVVIFKLEYSYGFFARALLGSNDPIQFFQAQVAWAF
jgi:hypothetical protein